MHNPDRTDSSRSRLAIGVLVALAGALLLAGCGLLASPEQKAIWKAQRQAQETYEANNRYRLQTALNRLPPAAVLECEMNSRMANASATHSRSDPLGIDSWWAGKQVGEACLAMMITRYGTLNP